MALGLLIPAAASAEDTDATERRARKACLSGDYTTGVNLLTDLFIATKDPGFIYNQGRCFEQNRRYDDAIARFQEFLRAGKNLKKSEKADAAKHIADCQELLAKQPTPQPTPAAGNAASAAAPAASGKEAKERAAKKACLAGDATAGVAILIDLYLDTNDTTYLFNQGRCLEQNRRYQDAIARFREYLVKRTNLTADERADTEKHIVACESYLKGGNAVESPTPDGAAKPAMEAPVVVESAPGRDVVPSPTEGIRREGSGLRAAGLIVAGLGAAGLAAGVVLNLKANSMSDALETNYDLDQDATRKSYKTGTWIAYGAGAACVAGGAILYYLGWRRGQQPSSLALLPTVRAGTVGTVVVGAF